VPEEIIASRAASESCVKPRAGTGEFDTAFGVEGTEESTAFVFAATAESGSVAATAGTSVDVI
jgi:hypothetical protein